MRWLVQSCLACLFLSFAGPARAMTRARRRENRELARSLWRHGFDSYMQHAFPADELLPLACKGQGHDHANPTNIDVNDVLGNYALTLVDALDSFPVMGDTAGFEQAVRQVILHVSFDQDAKVQVFEVVIRCLGGLLSGHIFASSEEYGYAIAWYADELLHLARDLGRRLLPAFHTLTGIPYARINLRSGISKFETHETCSAGAGSLLLEFATLSRLTGDDVYERVARRAFFAIWNRKSSINLVGNTINLQTGAWIAGIASTGAGIDSLYEYMLKSHVLLADDEYFRVWDEANAAILRFIRSPEGFFYRGVNMNTGAAVSADIDSLGAYLSGLLVLSGDVDSAIRAHLVYANLWRRYSAMPETFNIARVEAVSPGYPLRPEFVESTYLLHRATDDPFYLRIGERILHDLANRTVVPCGLASLKSVYTGEHDDRMHSFVLSETLKYAWLLFDDTPEPKAYGGNAVWTTEGHLLKLERQHLRRPSRLTRGESPVCAAYEPREGETHWTALKLGVEGRADAEYARFITGLELDEEEAMRSGVWHVDGYCAVPKQEEHLVELLFTVGDEKEDVAPSSAKVQQTAAGIHITSIRSLRLSMQRRFDSRFDVVRVGPFRVAAGGQVTVSDPFLHTALRSTAPPLVRLRFGGASLEADVQPASFGPSFNETLQRLPLAELVLPPADNEHGCEPYIVNGGSVIVLKRGECTFGRKASAVTVMGEAVILVVDDGDGVLPVADGDAENEARVPLGMVSAKTGATLDRMVMAAGGEGVRVQAVDVKEKTEEVIINGYRLRNLRLVP